MEIRYNWINQFREHGNIVGTGQSIKNQSMSFYLDYILLSK